MYLGPPCYSYALNCHLGYLAIPGTRQLCKKGQNLLFYSNATAKSEIQICSNKRETSSYTKHKKSCYLQISMFSCQAAVKT